jgi:hypothetical protein
MKYSNVKGMIAEKVSLYSKHLDKAIDSLNKAEDIACAKNMKLIELRNYQIKCLYDFAEYNSSIPKIKFGDKSIVDRANVLNSALFQYYIKADILYCGIVVSSYLKLIREWMKDENEYAIKDNLFNSGILYGMKIKCLTTSVIPRDEFVYINRESDEIIKYKIEGIN